MNARRADKNQNWRSRLQRNFFGLSDNYIASVYEEFFQLKYHGGWSFFEAYNLPILVRRWFLERLASQYKDEAEAQKKAMDRARSRSPRR